MSSKVSLGTLGVFVANCSLSQMAYAQQADPHGWLGTETLKTRSGDFQFKDGYPVGDTAQRLLDLQKLNRAVEVYTTHLMAVSDIMATREGLKDFGAKTALLPGRWTRAIWREWVWLVPAFSMIACVYLTLPGFRL